MYTVDFCQRIQYLPVASVPRRTSAVHNRPYVYPDSFIVVLGRASIVGWLLVFEYSSLHLPVFVQPVSAHGAGL